MKKLITATLLLATPLAASDGVRGEIPTIAQADPIQTEHYAPDLANLTCSYLDLQTSVDFEARLVGARGDFFQFFAQMGNSGVFQPSRAYYLGTGPLDPSGFGALSVPLPPLDIMPVNFEVEFYARYWTDFGQPMVTAPAFFRFNQYPEDQFDLDWAPGGVALPAGLPVDEHWSQLGMHISGKNHYNSPPIGGTAHPDKVILFDSAFPTGDDPDLATPSSGWMNDKALGNLLIIAEDDYDADLDGLVDDPDDEALGGTFYFEFDMPVTLGEITLIDIETYETVAMRAYDGSVLMQDIVFEGRGDGSAMTIGFAANPVTYMEIELSGSGGIGGFTMSTCDTWVAFDESTTGVPTGLQTGELLGLQFDDQLGFEISARSNVFGTDRAIIFDTAFPTGDDFDLLTPGYHPTNTVPYRKVMILAENLIDVDNDGYVDEPDDDTYGGVLSFEFRYDIVFQSATVIDIDSYEEAWFEAYDFRGQLVGVVPLSSLGDNSVETVYPALGGVRLVELHMTGSGAIAEFAFCRDDLVIDG